MRIQTMDSTPIILMLGRAPRVVLLVVKPASFLQMGVIYKQIAKRRMARGVQAGCALVRDASPKMERRDTTKQSIRGGI